MMHCVWFLYPVKQNLERINDLKNKNNLNLIDGIEFPVKLKDICRFEKKI